MPLKPRFIGLRRLMTRLLSWLGCCGLLLAWGCDDSSNPQAPSLLVLAAASAEPALAQAARAFEAQDAARVTISSGPSNTLAAQVQAGAPADLFLSADERWARDTVDRGLGVELLPLLSNRLVLAAPRGRSQVLQSPSELLAPRFRLVALAPEAAPVGHYAAQALRRAGVYDGLLQSGRVIRAADATALLRLVAADEVDAAVIYASDLLRSPRVLSVWAFDAATHDPIVYPLLTTPRGRANPAALRFRSFLLTPEAHAIFQAHGFHAPPPGPAPAR